MAEPTSVALVAASIPSSADIARAEKLVRERFLHDGEEPTVALATGTPRRRALDQALAELQDGAKHPSTAWRREFSLLLGLERVLSEDEPKLVDGTVLSAHQVDALSGTLTALLAEALRTENGNGRAAASPELLASAAILGLDEVTPPEDFAAEGPAGDPAKADFAGDDEDDEDDEEPDEESEDEDDDDLGPVQRAAPDEDDEDDELEDELEDELDPLAEEEQEPELQSDSDEEPRDWIDEDDGEEILAEQPEDPNAAKRFWFEHATGAGKTVAALGFVEASHTGGVLILTHRRNLVDQFHGELRDRGYS